MIALLELIIAIIAKCYCIIYSNEKLLEARSNLLLIWRISKFNAKSAALLIKSESRDRANS